MYGDQQSRRRLQLETSAYSRREPLSGVRAVRTRTITLTANLTVGCCLTVLVVIEIANGEHIEDEGFRGGRERIGI